MVTRKKAHAQTPPKSEPPSPEAIPNFLVELRKLVSHQRWLDISPESQSDDKVPRVFTTVIRASDADDFKKAFKQHDLFVNYAKTHQNTDPENAYTQYAILTCYPSTLNGNTKGFTWEHETQLAHIKPDGYPEKVSLRGVTLKLIKPEDEHSQWRRVELSIPVSKSPSPAERTGKPLIPVKNLIDIGDVRLPPHSKHGALRANTENLITMAHNAHLALHFDVSTGTHKLALPFPSSMNADLVTFLQDANHIHDFEIKSRDNDRKSPILIASPEILRQAFGNMPALEKVTSRIQANTAFVASPSRKAKGFGRGGEYND